MMRKRTSSQSPRNELINKFVQMLKRNKFTLALSAKGQWYISDREGNMWLMSALWDEVYEDLIPEPRHSRAKTYEAIHGQVRPEDRPGWGGGEEGGR